MGMYTELLLRCEIKHNMPEQVRAVVEFLFGDGDWPTELPGHLFFMCPRWTMVGRCNSYYHFPGAINRMIAEHRSTYLFSRSDLKNYDDEIEHFLDWFMPFIDEPVGAWIGHKFYEEANSPTPLFKLAAPERDGEE